MALPDTPLESHTLSFQQMSERARMNTTKFPVAYLRRIGPDDEYKCICLDSYEVSVGRAKENTYTITDLLISRKHIVFRLKNEHWTLESVGMNGVSVNHVGLPKGSQIPLQHMDTIEFGGSKFVYAFRLQSLEVRDEPLAKRMRIPLLDRNYPSFRNSPEALQNWIRSKKTLEKTLVEENDSLDLKLEQQNTLKNKLLMEKAKLNDHLENVKVELELKFNKEKKELEERVARGEIEKNELQRENEVLEERMLTSLKEIKAECVRKTQEFEERITQLNLVNQTLVEQKEFVVQQLTREKNILQERLEEESRLREETLNELTQIKQSHQLLEQELEEARRKIEEEAKQFQSKGNEDKSLLRRMQEELAEREVQLVAKEKEVCDIQSRAAIGLEMYEAIQVLQQGQTVENMGNLMIVLDDGQIPNQQSLSELDKVREELRLHKELNEQQLLQASKQARTDLVGRMESIMENELQCGICSELMVFATSLNCMHTFCQYCVNQWKKNKVECPICRAPITTEGRNLLVDNMIDAMVNSLSEDMKTGRKKLLEQRKELAQQQMNEFKQTERIVFSNTGASTETLQSGGGAEASISLRGRPRRTTGRVGATVASRVTLTAPPTITIHGPVRTRPSASARQSVRPPVSQGPTRPIGQLVQTTRSANSDLRVAGPNPIIVSVEEVVLSSGTDSTNEDTNGSGIIFELNRENGNRRYGRRKRTICRSCGRSKRINLSCDTCDF